MTQQYTLSQLIVPVLLAMLGSSVLAAWVTAVITSRSAWRLKQGEYVEKIQAEVRAELRGDLDEAKLLLTAVCDENGRQQRLIERVIDNLNPFARNVARLCTTVRQFLPVQHRHLADDVLADVRRLLELLGQAEAILRLDQLANEADATGPPGTGPPGAPAPPGTPPAQAAGGA